MTNLVYFEDQ